MADSLILGNLNIGPIKSKSPVLPRINNKLAKSFDKSSKVEFQSKVFHFFFNLNSFHRFCGK